MHLWTETYNGKGGLCSGNWKKGNDAFKKRASSLPTRAMFLMTLLLKMSRYCPNDNGQVCRR
jgi:hypothetical protein